MNLGVIEEYLLRALRSNLGKGVELQTGPAFNGPATGVRAQIFVHAARLIDHGGIMPDGAAVARHHVKARGGVEGFHELRPVTIEIEITSVCALHAQANALSGLITAESIEALERLAPPLLTDPVDPLRQVRLVDHQAHLHATRSERIEHDGAAAARLLAIFRLEGFLDIRIARKGGLETQSIYDVPLSLKLNANPKGSDIEKEYLEVTNTSGAPINLGGWSVRDSAKRPHRYVFPVSYQLMAGASVRLWSGRGQNDTANLYWGRRKAVWTNSGDRASLRDPENVERAAVAVSRRRR